MDSAYASKHRGKVASHHRRVSDPNPVQQLPRVHVLGAQGQGRAGRVHQPGPPLQTRPCGGLILLPIQVSQQCT